MRRSFRTLPLLEANPACSIPMYSLPQSRLPNPPVLASCVQEPSKHYSAPRSARSPARVRCFQAYAVRTQDRTCALQFPMPVYLAKRVSVVRHFPREPIPFWYSQCIFPGRIHRFSLHLLYLRGNWKAQRVHVARSKDVTGVIYGRGIVGF